MGILAINQSYLLQSLHHSYYRHASSPVKSDPVLLRFRSFHSPFSTNGDNMLIFLYHKKTFSINKLLMKYGDKNLPEGCR